MMAFKRISVQHQASKRTQHRQGAMFAYFMVYLMLAGATTATAGMLLHQMFKARTADVDASNGIRQLLRTDRQLRTDWNEAIQHTVDLDSMTLRTADQSTIEYSVKADRLQRIVRSQDQQIQSSDRFQFPKASQLQFAEGGVGGIAGVTFWLISPDLGQTSKSKNSKSEPEVNVASGRVVEIFLAAGELTMEDPE